MKKLLSFLLFLLLYNGLLAQLDREHWFAPMVDRTGNPNPYQKLYLSTNRTTPFPVSIYNNNTLIGTVIISKGNPQKFDVPRQHIITTQQSDLFTPITKGLHVQAEFPFYANLRFSVFNHAEIVTSKGIASKGTLFYTAVAPIMVQNPILNFMTSILATENNTTVTVSDYAPGIQFSNGTTGAAVPSLTFVLNKGQSYIIEGSGSMAANGTGFIGSKIVSDKPVNVTNGNFNGQYAGAIATSSDILMDQSVPVSRLGNTFALVKGNGSIGNNMEGALIIATQDNTQIFVNNEGLVATINEGEYYRVPESKYVLQGNNHYNLYISTSHNAYVYQLLAGFDDAGVSVATGGFNFIPALNCYLPKQIDELGFIDENQVHSNANPTGVLNIPTKLNLITEVGAVVTINGVPPPAGTGPFNMSGTTNWVTYGIPNVSGHITVNSSKAITAGINAGTDAVGYGGFFAGFPTQPVIIATGTCIPGITLTVDPIIYDSYQWYLNGSLIPNATNPSFTPTLPGFYTASVTMGSCAPLVTEPHKVEKCMVNSSEQYTLCTNQEITPAFSSVSIPQAIDISTIAIISQPTLGTVTINPTTGQIVYTANAQSVGVDTFTYTFCGNHPDFPECETVTVTLNIAQVLVNNATVKGCEIQGQGIFNLTTANVTTQSPVTITYYPTLADAQNENPAALITNSTAYVAAPGTAFAVVKSPEGCKSIAQITLELFPLAVVADFTGSFCDDDLDGNINVDLSTITPQILPNAGYFTVRYYANVSDANAGNANVLPLLWSYTADTIIYIRVDSPDGCPAVIKPLNFLAGTKVQLLSDNMNQSVCDVDLDGIQQVNLSTFLFHFTTDALVTATYYASQSDAQQAVNPISSAVTVNVLETFYIRFERPNFCPVVGILSIYIKVPKKSDTLADQEVCPDTKALLDAGDNFESYLWSTGETTQTILAGAGTYWVDLTFDGCVYRQSVTVSELEVPVITAIDIQKGNITVTVTGGYPPYEYSIDGFQWQTSNVFLGLPRGEYTLYVRDSSRCGVITMDFSIINLINAITPNEDGLNETIDYSSLMSKKDLVFKIYDRYGKEVFVGTPANKYTWDGIFQGRRVPTATYWYILQWRELGTVTVTKHTSFLLVKNVSK